MTACTEWSFSLPPLCKWTIGGKTPTAALRVCVCASAGAWLGDIRIFCRPNYSCIKRMASTRDSSIQFFSAPLFLFWGPRARHRSRLHKESLWGIQSILCRAKLECSTSVSDFFRQLRTLPSCMKYFRIVVKKESRDKLAKEVPAVAIWDFPPGWPMHFLPMRRHTAVSHLKQRTLEQNTFIIQNM